MIVEVVGAVIRDAAGRLHPTSPPDITLAPLLSGQILPALIAAS